MSILNLLLTAAKAAEQTSEKASKLKSFAEEFSGLPLDKIIEKLLGIAVDFTLKLIVAILVFYLGKLIINRIYKSVKSIMLRRNVDQSLATFILSVVKVVMLFILIVIVISILGIETSSFIALFASAGVAIGMALSGTLQNFAGGVLILLLKPYKVGDFIEFQGFTGTVKEIQIFNTKINTVDNKSIFIPNGGLSTGSIKNYSNEDYRRVDWTVNIAYGNDYSIAKDAIMKIIRNDNRIVKKYIADDRKERNEEIKEEKNESNDNGIENKIEKKRIFGIFHNKEKVIGKLQMIQKGKDDFHAPQADCSPFIALGALSSSSVDIIVRAWVPTKYYWDVFYDINEQIYKQLPVAGIEFPFPQMDVHVKQ